jgi:hypothetical protein
MAARHRQESSAGYVFFSLFVGIVVADLQREVLAKPFSFCMPGHRRLSRHLIFGIGSVVNLLLGILFSKYLGLEFPYILLAVLAVSFVGMICYLFSAWLVLAMKNPVIGLLGLMVFPLVFLSDYLKPVEHMVVSSPLLPIAVGILTFGIAWKWLGRKSLARKHCGVSLVGLTDSWNFWKMRKIQQKRAAQKIAKRGSLVYDRLEGLILRKMKVCRPFSGNRYILGNLFIIFGRSFGLKLAIGYLLSLVMAGLMFGYFDDVILDTYFFMITAIMGIHFNLMPCRSMLLPAGRTKKYYSAVVSGFVATSLMTFLVAIIAAMTIPLDHIMPDIAWRGITFTFHVIGMQKSFIPLILGPIALIVGTLFPNKRVTVLIFMIAIIATVGVIAFITTLASIFIDSIFGIASLVAASWITFLVLFGYHCRKRSLIGA